MRKEGGRLASSRPPSLPRPGGEATPGKPIAAPLCRLRAGPNGPRLRPFRVTALRESWSLSTSATNRHEVHPSIVRETRAAGTTPSAARSPRTRSRRSPKASRWSERWPGPEDRRPAPARRAIRGLGRGRREPPACRRVGYGGARGDSAAPPGCDANKAKDRARDRLAGRRSPPSAGDGRVGRAYLNGLGGTAYRPQTTSRSGRPLFYADSGVVAWTTLVAGFPPGASTHPMSSRPGRL